MKPKTIERGGRPSRSVVINLETHFCIRAHAPAMFLKCLPFRILARNARMCCSYWCLALPSFLLTGLLATEWFMDTTKTPHHDSRLQILTISLLSGWVFIFSPNEFGFFLLPSLCYYWSLHPSQKVAADDALNFFIFIYLVALYVLSRCP